MLTVTCCPGKSALGLDPSTPLTDRTATGALSEYFSTAAAGTAKATISKNAKVKETALFI